MSKPEDKALWELINQKIEQGLGTRLMSIVANLEEEVRKYKIGAFRCPRCQKHVYVQHSKTLLCMDCYVPTQVKPGKCRRCDRLIIKENPGRTCFVCQGKIYSQSMGAK